MSIYATAIKSRTLVILLMPRIDSLTPYSMTSATTRFSQATPISRRLNMRHGRHFLIFYTRPPLSAHAIISFRRAAISPPRRHAYAILSRPPHATSHVRHADSRIAADDYFRCFLSYFDELPLIRALLR